jgi:hypothetical protein
MNKKSYGVIIFLFLFCTVQAKNIVKITDTFNPTQIHVTKDRMYIVDGVIIRIYSLKDFQLIKKLGKEGEGPQEFKDAIHWIYFKGNKMIVNSQAKISYFSRDGKFITEKKSFAGNRAGDFCPIGNQFVAVQFLTDKMTFYTTVNIYNSNLKKIKEIYRIKEEFQPGKYMRAYSEPKTFSVYDDKIYVSFDNEFKITVFNDQGIKEFVISKDYQRLEITKEHQKAAHQYFKTDPYYKNYYNRIKPLLEFPTHLPAVKTFSFSEEKLYVHTYNKKDKRTEFFVFTPNGKFIETIFLPIIGEEELTYKLQTIYEFKNGNLYQLVENDDTEEWEIHITNLEGYQ